MRRLLVAIALAGCSTAVKTTAAPPGARPPAERDATAPAETNELSDGRTDGAAARWTEAEQRGTTDGPSLTQADAPAPADGAPADSAAAPTTSGYPPEVIRRVIRQRARALQACYQRRLAEAPNLAGQVRIRFVIGPTGAVTEAVVASGFDAAVDRCVADVLRAAVFDPPADGGSVVVTYPFVFASAS